MFVLQRVFELTLTERMTDFQTAMNNAPFKHRKFW